jgi:hypothetical protein
MTARASYGTSPIKRRRTKAQMEAIRNAIIAVLVDDHPVTVRQAFYRLTSAGVIAKTEAEYKGTVCRLLGEMRRSGEIPYERIADSTRWMRKPITFDSIEDALRSTAATYRRALWSDSTVAVEIWVEKEALAGVLVEITDPWDSPLMVTRGYPSMSFLHDAAVQIRRRYENGQLTHIYYFGDHDPSGVDIDRAIRQGIGESLEALELAEVRRNLRDGSKRLPGRWLYGSLGEDEDATDAERAFDYYAAFERIAVTPQQVTAWNLPTRPTKRSDTRSKTFKGDSVELDAIPPAQLRQLAEACIEQHVDQHQLEVVRTYEEEERKGLERIAETYNGGPAGGEG